MYHSGQIGRYIIYTMVAKLVAMP